MKKVSHIFTQYITFQSLLVHSRDVFSHLNQPGKAYVCLYLNSLTAFGIIKYIYTDILSPKTHLISTLDTSYKKSYDEYKTSTNWELHIDISTLIIYVPPNIEWWWATYDDDQNQRPKDIIISYRQTSLLFLFLILLNYNILFCFYHCSYLSLYLQLAQFVGYIKVVEMLIPEDESENDYTERIRQYGKINGTLVAMISWSCYKNPICQNLLRGYTGHNERIINCT